MQTHTDRRSPSQVKVGHRGGAEQGKVQALPRFFHAHHQNLHRGLVIVSTLSFAFGMREEPDIRIFIEASSSFRLLPCASCLVSQGRSVVARGCDTERPRVVRKTITWGSRSKWTGINVKGIKWLVKRIKVARINTYPPVDKTAYPHLFRTSTADNPLFHH